MKTRVPSILLLCLLVGVVLLMTHSGDGRPAYVVAAQFDNSGAIVVGEDVEIAGGIVGTVQALGLTRGYKAVLTLRINDSRWVPFHDDASCTIRSQGVLAVEFVNCDPGTAASPALPTDPGGIHLLSVQHTSSPIEFDLVTNIMREPAGEYLATLLDELGTGLAARGGDLNAVLRRANRGLAATDQVLQILARQNRNLKRLAISADAVLRPLAGQRASLGRFVSEAALTAQAPAQQSGNVERSIARLPAFLRELRPTLARLGALSDEGAPVLADLHATAPSLNSSIIALRPFSDRGLPALRSLGALAETATPALLQSRPLIQDAAQLGAHLSPSAANLSALTRSFQQQGGITHLLQLLFYSTSAVNGFDADGHYARAELLSGACSEYTPKGYFGCQSQFGGTSQVANPVAADVGTTHFKQLLSYLIGRR